MRPIHSRERLSASQRLKPIDLDKLRAFQAAAEAGSFTHAGEIIGLSQSAVSRQVSALESELGVTLFHRHARGLRLTEQGELLFRTARDVLLRLENTRAKLMDTSETPRGELRVTTSVGLGSGWLAPRMREFAETYPEVGVQLILTDEELDLAMRAADVAIWAAPAESGRPHPAQALHRALPRLRVAGLSRGLRHAGDTRGPRQPPHRRHGSADPELSSGHQLAAERGTRGDGAASFRPGRSTTSSASSARCRPGSASRCCRTTSSAKMQASCASWRRRTCCPSIPTSPTRRR